MMVGRAVSLNIDKKPAKPKDTVLSVQNLTVADDRKQIAVNNISFEVKAGEVLGVAGVQGNGQTELVEALTGLRSSLNGEINLLGNDISKATPRQIKELGTGHIPEDRQADGLVLDFPIKDNMVLNTYYKSPFSKGLNLQEDKILENSEKLIKDYDVRTPQCLYLSWITFWWKSTKSHCCQRIFSRTQYAHRLSTHPWVRCWLHRIYSQTDYQKT